MSLCNAREYISRRQVSKDVKVFSVGDEFVLHFFKAHLVASICTILRIGLPTDPIEHIDSIERLRETAATLVSKTISPYNLPRSSLHISSFVHAHGFLVLGFKECH